METLSKSLKSDYVGCSENDSATLLMDRPPARQDRCILRRQWQG